MIMVLVKKQEGVYYRRRMTVLLQVVASLLATKILLTLLIFKPRDMDGSRLLIRAERTA